MTTHLYLVRHGETDWNKWRKVQGHSDIPLNATGEMQARQVAKRLAEVPLEAVISSDLRRAKQTAEVIQKYHSNIKELFVYPELRERNYGEWEGKIIDDIVKEYADYKAGQEVGGLFGIETIQEMKNRAMSLLQSLSLEYHDHHLAVVSHGGLINAVLHQLSNGEVGTGKTKLLNTCLNYFSFDSGKWSIHYINDISHLNE
jgi:broad specificity phosphatase PhoE